MKKQRYEFFIENDLQIIKKSEQSIKDIINSNANLNEKKQALIYEIHPLDQVIILPKDVILH